MLAAWRLRQKAQSQSRAVWRGTSSPPPNYTDVRQGEPSGRFTQEVRLPFAKRSHVLGQINVQPDFRGLATQSFAGFGHHFERLDDKASRVELRQIAR